MDRTPGRPGKRGHSQSHTREMNRQVLWLRMLPLLLWIILTIIVPFHSSLRSDLLINDHVSMPKAGFLCVWPTPSPTRFVLSPALLSESQIYLFELYVFCFPLGEQLQGLGFIQVAPVFGLRHSFQADILFIFMSFSFCYGKTMRDT